MSRWIIAVVAALTGLAICAEPAVAADSSFYDVDVRNTAGRAGQLLRIEPLPATRDATTYRVLYRSMGAKGEPIAVSGAVAVPRGQSPRGERPVVSWAHGTSGVARGCAPSKQASVFNDIAGFHQMMARGYVVVATDYPGLGARGTHGYLIASSEARAVLDGVRAARRVPGARAGKRFATWGFSQGGQASLEAAAIAWRYAPELKMVGAAASAPPTDLEKLFNADGKTRAGKVFSSYAISSWARIYGADPGQVVVPGAEPAMAKISTLCSSTPEEDLSLGAEALAFDASGFIRQGGDRRRWVQIMRQNSVGVTAPGVPVFIAQGKSDKFVDPSVTRDYISKLCRAGRRVRYIEYPDADHSGTAGISAGAGVHWLAGRFNREPAPNDCPPVARRRVDRSR